jgi:HEPN domain
MGVASRHLETVRDSWDPADWSDLSTYGLYCLEALVRAALLKLGKEPSRNHWQKSREAETLHRDHGFPDISDLMGILNSARKANAYGDDEFDEGEHDAEDIATRVEEYYDHVRHFLDS